MASLFVTPSSVVERLRYMRDLYQQNYDTFPEFNIMGSGELDLMKKDSSKSSDITLYVTASSGSGSLESKAGRYQTLVLTNIQIVLLVKAEDIRADQANELGIGFKNFLIRSLHTWEEGEIPGYEPLRYTSDSQFDTLGHATYIHSYTFSQEKLVGPSCFEDLTGNWENLDWFNLAVTSAVFRTADGDDSETLIWRAEPV